MSGTINWFKTDESLGQKWQSLKETAKDGIDEAPPPILLNVGLKQRLLLWLAWWWCHNNLNSYVPIETAGHSSVLRSFLFSYILSEKWGYVSPISPRFLQHWCIASLRCTVVNFYNTEICELTDNMMSNRLGQTSTTVLFNSLPPVMGSNGNDLKRRFHDLTGK